MEYKINTKNQNPNLTIILPGTCQAKCDFCFWKENKNYENFLKGLKKTLKRLPKIMTQISISGGEPTLSPVFDDAMALIKKARKKNKIKKVVLTTNGIHLQKMNLEGIDHINISRHHIKDDINEEIFNTKNIPSTSDLMRINEYVNKAGIDVNYNFVATELNDDICYDEWVNFVKLTGATSVTFRNQYGVYDMHYLEKEILEDNYKPKVVETCPVCRKSRFYVSGVQMIFHSSAYEPTEEKVFKEDEEVYELILQQNGILTMDWEEKKPVDLKISTIKINISEASSDIEYFDSLLVNDSLSKKEKEETLFNKTLSEIRYNKLIKKLKKEQK